MDVPSPIRLSGIHCSQPPETDNHPATAVGVALDHEEVFLQIS
jgi:hypothetical protein